MPSISRRNEQPGGANEEVDAYAAKLQALFDRVAPRVPDIDPGVVLQVLDAHLRPIGGGHGRRFLLRRGPDGRYGP